ncbi:hypothetical protein CEQ90_01830 [Lewinellaceae bacterium SD302]|nr:hypothetical protein CEQ90_01830 [Lewinellaceae bacterium SD302]
MVSLTKTAIEGDLIITAPDGTGAVSISGGSTGPLRVNASDYPTLRQLAADARQASPALGPRTIAGQRNPFGQEIAVLVDDKPVVSWPAGGRIRVNNLVRALRFLAG